MNSEAPSVWDGILRNSIAILAIVIALSLYKNGVWFWTGWRPQNVIAGVIFIPLAAAVIWLRRDWAPFAAKQRRKG